MNREKEFVKNTLILFIGKFATQFSSFLLIPLFTHYLQTSDYGWVDLLQTYIILFVPVLTLRMDSAVFRFLIDNRQNKKESSVVISNAIILTFFMILFSVSVFLIIGLFIQIKYFQLILINLIIMMFSNVFLQILRGTGKNKQYSISSIITGITNLIINTILIIIFKFGAGSIFIASSISNVFVIIYVFCVAKLPQYISYKLFNKETLKELLKYSIPMIPNSLSWWIVNISDRTIISAFLGTAYNGIYTISCKFSNLINSLFSIFNISWQETASVHIKDKDNNVFFTNIINEILFSFMSVSLVINALLPLFYNILIGNDYINSYNYIPILLYANIFNILISLIGGIYIALKKTKEIATTTIVSAILNITINFAFIKYIGLYAACFSTLIAYISMAVYRYYDIQKYINIKLNMNKFIIFSIVFYLSSYIYFKNIMYLNILNSILVSLFVAFTNKNNILKIIKTLGNKFKKNTTEKFN